MKLKGDIYPQKLDWNDQEFLKKNAIIQSVNYLHDQTRKDKGMLETRILFILSLGLTLLATIFSWLVKIAILFLIFLLIYSIIQYSRKRKKFWKNRVIMKESFENFGLKWEE